MSNLAPLSYPNSYVISALLCLLVIPPFACAPSARQTEQQAIQSPPAASTSTAGSKQNTIVSASPTDEDPADTTTISTEKPVAIIDGRRVTWKHLQPLLAEASGGMILEEHILHQQINGELTKANITLNPTAAENEETLLLESINDDPDMAIRLLREIRVRQGLGDQRYANLLWRNAALRALVQTDVELQEDAIKRLYDVMYGAKRTGRIAVYSDLSDAHRAKERIDAGEPFVDIISDSSIATSATTGGKFGPLSQDDPEYPTPLRDTLWNMQLGQYSSPVLFQERYAIIQFIDETPAENITLEQAQPDLQRALRLTQERLLMNEHARGLVNGAEVTIFDLPLKQGHQQYKRQQSP